MPTENSRYNIDAINLHGQGTSLLADGRHIFIDGALPFESVEAEILRSNDKYQQAVAGRIFNASPDRVVPFCSIFLQCGGCQLQHLSYPAQLQLKKQLLQNTLAQAGIHAMNIASPRGMKNPYHYRNKALYPLAGEPGQVKAGFYASHSHQVVSHEQCLVQDSVFAEIRDFIVEFINTHKLSAYNELKHEGLFRHILLRRGARSRQIMLVLVLTQADFPGSRELASQLQAEFPDLVSIVLNHHAAATNSIFGGNNHFLAGQKTIRDRLGDFDITLSPFSFYQINSEQALFIYRRVTELARLDKSQTVLELYSGTGTLSLFLASQAKQLLGLEISQAATQDAAENARANGLDNCRFIAGDVAESLPGGEFDLLVLNPPRRGVDQKTLQMAAAKNCPQIIYVSCNMVSLARDLEILLQAGYRLEQIEPVDMFPFTSHLEIICHLRKD